MKRLKKKYAQLNIYLEITLKNILWGKNICEAISRIFCDIFHKFVNGRELIVVSKDV